MLGVIISRGKNVAEAVSKAAHQLNVSEEQIRYEVVDKGRRRLFSHSPVVIQATVKKDTLQEAKSTEQGNLAYSFEQKHPDDAGLEEQVSAGLAWVLNNEISCRNGTEHYALITPCDGLLLKVNGEIVSDTTVVSEEDEISVEFVNEHVASKINFTVSKDKMQVILDIVPGYSTSKHLKDIPPSRELKLEVVETKSVKNDITQLQVYEELKKLGVKIGIEHEEIVLACNSKEPITRVIAKGIEPILGKDGEFEFLYTKRKEEKDQFSLSNTIDWKERFSLPTVKAGEVIGRRIAAEPGVDGRNVFGQQVPTPKVTEISLATGDGTTLHARDEKVIATVSGRIKVQTRSKYTLLFSIIPQYIHNGNVDIQTGNIHFHGDVYILGSVEEGMTVEAGGSLNVTGSVSGANIRSDGDVVINGAVIGTEIVCGYANLFWDNLLSDFKLVHDNLKGLIAAARQLESKRAFSRGDIAQGLQPLLRLLTEVKFTELPDRIRKITKIVKNARDSFDADTYQIVDFLEKAFLYFHPLVSELKQLESVVGVMSRVITAVEYDSNKKINIKVQSLTNSSIKSAWDVGVERFCYGSYLYCKGGVEVGGTLRGGQIHAGIFATATEIGSNGGSKTKVSVASKNGYVDAGIVWTDTTLKISNSAIKLINQETFVSARIDDHGKLHLR